MNLFCDYLFEFQSHFQILIRRQKNSGLSAQKSQLRHLGILRKSPKLMRRVGMDALPYRMSSGDYHRNGNKRWCSEFGAYWT
jgi:hypothetical protein